MSVRLEGGGRFGLAKGQWARRRALMREQRREDSPNGTPAPATYAWVKP